MRSMVSQGSLRTVIKGCIAGPIFIVLLKLFSVAFHVSFGLNFADASYSLSIYVLGTRHDTDLVFLV